MSIVGDNAYAEGYKLIFYRLRNRIWQGTTQCSAGTVKLDIFGNNPEILRGEMYPHTNRKLTEQLKKIELGEDKYVYYPQNYSGSTVMLY